MNLDGKKTMIVVVTALSCATVALSFGGIESGDFMTAYVAALAVWGGREAITKLKGGTQ